MRFFCIFFLCIQSRNGSRVLLGVVPRLPFRSEGAKICGSIDGFRGVRIPDGVELPLTFRLVQEGEIIENTHNFIYLFISYQGEVVLMIIAK